MKMSFKFDLLGEKQLNHTEMIYDSQIHGSNANILAVSTIEGDIQLIDMNCSDNYLINNYKRHHKGSPIRRIRFVDDNLLVSAAKTIKIMDINTGKVIRKIDNNGVKIYSLLVIDNYLLCIGDDEGNFKAWDYRLDRGVYMTLHECDHYISDLDIDNDKRIVVAASGEGTLSAFNIRAKKMETPQSELFDAGFQCVRYLHSKDKVVVGAEDGALNIFNVNEWGNISDRFPIRGNSTRAQGFCSVDCIEVIAEHAIIAGTSDGKLRAISILPNQVLCDICTHSSSVETLTVDKNNNKIVSTNDNIIKIFDFKETKLRKKESNKSDFFSDL